MLSFLIVREQQNTIARLPDCPAQNENINRLEGVVQRGPLEKGSNNPRIGNPDGIRLREVSELRSCLFFRLTS